MARKKNGYKAEDETGTEQGGHEGRADTAHGPAPKRAGKRGGRARRAGAGGARPQDLEPVPPGNGAPSGGPAQPRPLESMEQYLVAPRLTPFGPFGMLGALPQGIDQTFVAQNVSHLQSRLSQFPGAQLVRTIVPQGDAAMQSADQPPVPPIHVVRMPPDRAFAMAQSEGQQFIIEVDEPLLMADAGLPEGIRVRDPGVLFPLDASVALTATIEVTGGGRPVSGCAVYVYGSAFPAQGITDQRGRVTITLPNETPETVRGVLIKPAAGFWTRWISRPRLDPGGLHTVSVRPLTETYPMLHSQEIVGWGQRLMNLDKIRPNLRGQGIKVAIIDSGAAGTHKDLSFIRLGSDVQADGAATWNQDMTGHGSHCAGIICGSAANNSGVRGFAPDAEIHVIKVFPRGSASDIAAALQYCIKNNIDVVNLSLGMDNNVSLIESLFAKAKSLGIACVAAAGNSGGKVMFPARLNDVLCVSAIGQWGTFPDDSYHALQSADPTRRDGLFSARFTCFGPEVDVAGPGVAVVSSVPPDDFVPMDGTSMAAPHITGLAALVMAHHPALRGMPRNAARVDALFQILRQSAMALSFADSSRVGAGLPDAVRALQGAAAMQPAAGAGSGQQGQIDPAEMIRRAIEEALRAFGSGSGASGQMASAMSVAPQFSGPGRSYR